MDVFTLRKQEVRFSAKVDSKGRITVPARIRNKLGLEKGDEIVLGLESGKVVREEVDSYQEALRFIKQFDSVQSFSFSDGVVEVVLCE